jgi:hypothetical protein
MQRIYGKNPTPNLKKRTNHLDFIYLNSIDVRSCIFITAVVLVLLISIMVVAAGPNSNLPLQVQ